MGDGTCKVNESQEEKKWNVSESQHCMQVEGGGCHFQVCTWPTTCMSPLYTRGRRGRNGGSPFPFLHGPCLPAPFACKLEQGCEGWVGKVCHSHVAPSSHANRGGRA